MDRHERITALHRTLKAARYPVTVARLMDELGCSRATVYRDLAYLRDALLAPIVGDGEAGFRYDANEHDRFELPGLWLSSEELYALLAAQQLLSRSTGGVMAQALAPMQQRIEQLLAQHAGGSQALPMQRMRIIAHRRRRVDEPVFRTVVGALMERKRLAFDYRARSNDTLARRQVSPQRLTHYRDNWYLDAWDHDREALRSFSLDRIAAPKRLDDEAHDVPDAELDHHLADGYGIFSGEAKGWATIVFSAKAARWVADERWHSRQQGRLLADGRYELKIPYSAARELLMDVLQYGADAEVTAPPVLREQARTLLSLALSNYER